MGLIAGLAAGADIPVFPVVGVGGRDLAARLPLLPGVRVVDHPRAAALLVVVGRPTRALLRPLLVVHDQLPPPRATVWWPVGVGGDDLVGAMAGVVVGDAGDSGVLRRVFADLVRGVRPSDPAALDDIEPAEWRGVGPYGQGGTGMTGGTPFGRPLPGRSPDPDGLQLDQLPLQVGPVFPPLPPGLILRLGVQGDILLTVSVGENPFTRWPDDPPLGPFDTATFFDALLAPMSIASLEVARARHHLRWVGAALGLHGLHARGRRLSALAQELTPAHRAAVEGIAAKLGRSRSLASAMTGIGVIEPERADASGGPVARASGLRVDARLGDPSYHGLGFEPIAHEAGDSWARFRQRLGEAAQALLLADRAGDRIRSPGPAVEGPRGPLIGGAATPSSRLLGLLPDLLSGLEWGDAMTTVVSLDLDLEEAALTEVAVPST